MVSRSRLRLVCVFAAFVHVQSESVKASTVNLAQSCQVTQSSLHECGAAAEDDVDVTRASDVSLLQTGLNRHAKRAASDRRRTSVRQCPLGVLSGHHLLVIDDKMLYCQIPKVATTSVYNVFLDEGILPTSFEPNDRCNAKCNYPRLKNLGFCDVDGDPCDLCNTFAFMFIRNPWDRLRSAYEDIVEEGVVGEPHLVHPEFDNMSFPQFVRAIAAQMLDGENVNSHYRPQSILCQPRSFEYDAIYKLEDGLEEQLRHAFAQNGIELSAPAEAFVSHVTTNTTHELEKRRSYYLGASGLLYEYELVDLVAVAYRDDVALGNYSFSKYN